MTRLLLGLASLVAAILLVLWALTREFPANPPQAAMSIPERFADSLAEVPADWPAVERGRSYMPAYGFVQKDGRRLKLSSTLTIHNISLSDFLLIEKIDYVNTNGQVVRNFIDHPIMLRPQASIQAYVDASEAAGSAANFLVEWASASEGPLPLLEVLMLGSDGLAGYAFVSSGTDIRR